MELEMWVIKRDDGLYYSSEHDAFYDNILRADFYDSKRDALEDIKEWRVRKSKPVKVRIEEIE